MYKTGPKVSCPWKIIISSKDLSGAGGRRGVRVRGSARTQVDTAPGYLLEARLPPSIADTCPDSAEGLSLQIFCSSLRHNY
jgi:hypothetical protein